MIEEKSRQSFFQRMIFILMKLIYELMKMFEINDKCLNRIKLFGIGWDLRIESISYWFNYCFICF